VEQQKPGPIGASGVLNDLARDVKQLQRLTTSGDVGECPDGAHTPFQGYARTPGQQGFNLAQPGLSLEGSPMGQTTQFYPAGNSGLMSNFATQSPSVPRLQTIPGRKESSREVQRRRLDLPTHSGTSTPPDLDVESEGAVDENNNIVQTAGQLSLDENRTVRYHGASSGLNLLTRSKRFDGTFSNLPNQGSPSNLPLNIGFWPASDRRTVKTELEVDSKTQLPPIKTQDRLLE
jgi:hypothetical protein